MPDPSESANLQMSTLRQATGVIDEAASVRVLTILCHPDPSRIGERARLDDRAIGYPFLVSRAVNPKGFSPRKAASTGSKNPAGQRLD